MIITATESVTSNLREYTPETRKLAVLVPETKPIYETLCHHASPVYYSVYIHLYRQMPQYIHL